MLKKINRYFKPHPRSEIERGYKEYHERMFKVVQKFAPIPVEYLYYLFIVVFVVLLLLQ